jgi:membrane protease YdiL (CAAX protease family)
MESHNRDILIFVALAYIFAFALDLSFYSSFGFLGGAVPPNKSSINIAAAVTVWGLIRMYMPAAAMMVILFKNRVGIRATIAKYMNINMKNLLWFIIGPSFVLLSIGLYIVLASPTGIVSFESMFSRILNSTTSSITPTQVSPSKLVMIILISGYFASITTNSFFAFGEELGWRGYLYSALNADNAPVRTGLIIGVIWGLWHTPIVIIPSISNIMEGLMHLFFYTLWIIVISISLNLIRLWSNSILPTISLHGGLNALWGLTILLSPQKDTLTYVLTESMGIFSWLLISLALWYIVKSISKNKRSSK